MLFVCPPEAHWLREGAFLFSSQPASGSILQGFAKRFGSSCFARMQGAFRGEASMMALFAEMPAQLAKSMYDSHVNALSHCIVWVLGFKSHPAVVGSMA